MIAQSQSGTGKTAAFVIAMLSRVDTNKNYPQILCLSPTYELAIQTGEVAAKIAQFSPIKLRYAVRGEESKFICQLIFLIKTNDNILNSFCFAWLVDRNAKLDDHIIIGTPGKVLDWSSKLRVFDIKKISVFVLDEADVMIATQGHQDQCIRIHKYATRNCFI